MTVITEKVLDELLDYLEKSINNLAKESFENLELEGGFQGVQNFLDNQFDIRLENLLVAKKSSTHHLESGIKNKIIQRKAKIMNDIAKEYQN
ncbi:hypothetical protein [Nitrosopumilus sp.]|uniref:hypothetical protein n=1 Tax=Nitrosopumilus sp. TaxID=2024843 RepID=UPI00262D6AB7|nr:hypothetical protein [Nitrosopumilus sp.]